MFDNVYAGRRVLVTGHTGFKGSWLALWLLELGAEVGGFAVDVPTCPSHFEATGLANRIRDFRSDIRDRDRFGDVVDEFQPEIVFHLAAQALVRRSYMDPVQTFEVNTIGTMNVLECLRHRPSVRAAVLITSDKCYRNVDWVWGYRENDTLGGEDPYSGSKGCAELVFHSYFHSFFKGDPGLAAVATTRAGNVIGGGDWAADRLVPDCVRSWSAGRVVAIRSPRATRPWQHVLEPLSGYLTLGAHLWRRDPVSVGSCYNFGPDASVDQSVEALIRTIALYWSMARWALDETAIRGVAEARLLKLSCDKAQAELGWRPTLSFDEAAQLTAAWYRRHYEDPGAGMLEYSLGQIREYCNLACRKKIAWSQR